MNALEHIAEADRLLERVSRRPTDEEYRVGAQLSPEDRRDFVTRAQAHATLALAMTESYRA